MHSLVYGKTNDIKQSVRMLLAMFATRKRFLKSWLEHVCNCEDSVNPWSRSERSQFLSTFPEVRPLMPEWMSFLYVEMGARIPSALIPSSKKRHSSWKILFIRLLGASVFFLPLLLFVSTNSFGTRRANLSSDEYLWIGYLSAYFCNVNNSRLSAQEGKTILDNLVATNRLPDSLVQNQ